MNKKIILASKSPQRKYLLKQAGIEFLVIPPQVDESEFNLTNPSDYVKKLAIAKAEYIAEKYPDSWVIGADTIVYINNTILEKPESKKNAVQMLKCLSAKTHVVYTGFSICCKNKAQKISRIAKTEVILKKMSDHEIKWYVNTKEPFDKAGAYAIQGLGASLVKSINGSYTNVVGLPVCEVIEDLISFKAIKKY